jgi:hypothetical protein
VLRYLTDALETARDEKQILLAASASERAIAIE